MCAQKNITATVSSERKVQTLLSCFTQSKTVRYIAVLNTTDLIHIIQQSTRTMEQTQATTTGIQLKSVEVTKLKVPTEIGDITLSDKADKILVVFKSADFYSEEAKDFFHQYPQNSALLVFQNGFMHITLFSSYQDEFDKRILVSLMNVSPTCRTLVVETSNEMAEECNKFDGMFHSAVNHQTEIRLQYYRDQIESRSRALLPNGRTVDEKNFNRGRLTEFCDITLKQIAQEFAKHKFTSFVEQLHYQELLKRYRMTMCRPASS